MKLKLLLPLLLVSATAHADLIPDRRAMTACDKRFDHINRSEALNLRPGAIHMVPTHTAGSYHYYFNARNHETNYRVECRARNNGRVLEFAIEQGKWVFDGPVSENVAPN